MTQESTQRAQEALADSAVLEDVVEQLGGENRLKRQKAASVIALVSDMDASVLVPHTDVLAEALFSPEAQTRWELLHAFDQLGKAGQRFDENVIEAAQDALYDEDNGIVREAAFRFFCGYGSASPENSDRVWPLIDEAVQCYHGNKEFADMLTDLVMFAQGDISPQASAALAQRMRFDSQSASGTLRMRSEQIVQAFFDRGGRFEDPEDPEDGQDEQAEG